MKAERVRSMILTSAGVLLAGVWGCVELPPPAESVLAGTWEIVSHESLNPQLAHWYLTFDSDGELAQVRYTFVDLTTVTWDYPPGSTSVDGDQVQISSTKSGNGLTFDGTLDSATEPTQATGSLTSNLIFGDLQISVSKGEATLVKQ